MNLVLRWRALVSSCSSEMFSAFSFRAKNEASTNEDIEILEEM